MISYLTYLVAIAAIYGIMALGLNIAWGLTGMINFGLMGFFAVGAYTSALVSLGVGVPSLTILLGTIAAGLAGVALAAGTGRLRGDYLAIVTLGAAELVRLFVSNEIWLTKGTDGLAGLPGLVPGGLAPRTATLVATAILLAVLVVAFVTAERLRSSAFGRALRAIRDDDTAAAAAGKNVQRLRIAAFGIGAAFTGLAGALYGHYTGFIAPDLLRPLITIYVFLALTAGGTGNNIGAVLGAYALIAALELTRFAPQVFTRLDGAQHGALREIIVAVALLLVLRFFPRGLLPEPVLRRPTSHAKDQEGR